MSPFLPLPLPFGLHLWIAARLMPLLVGSQRRFDAILEMAEVRGGPGVARGLGADAIVAAVKRAARRPWLMRDRRCLREGLLAYHYLSGAGYRPKLHFGVVPGTLDARRPGAHCWVAVEGRILLNPPDPNMIEIFAHGSTAASAHVPEVSDGRS